MRYMHFGCFHRWLEKPHCSCKPHKHMYGPMGSVEGILNTPYSNSPPPPLTSFRWIGLVLFCSTAEFDFALSLCPPSLPPPLPKRLDQQMDSGEEQAGGAGKEQEETEGAGG